MQTISKIISYGLHPLLIPFYAVLFYFYISPRFYEESVIKSVLFAVILLSFFAPLIFYILLKLSGKISDLSLSEVKERKWPLLINSILLSLITFKIFDINFNSVLYYFFLGLVISNITALALVFFAQFKTSLHSMNASALLFFIISVSLHYQVNVTVFIGIGCIAIGALYSARLYLKAHTLVELVIGSLAGGLIQLFCLPFWL